MQQSYSVVDLIPHRPPMALIDEIVDLDIEARRLTAAFTVRPEWTGNWVAIEYMAQTAAALAGVFDRLENADRPARPGFLLGTRRLSLNLPRFELGARYLATASCEFADAEAASFACAILTEAGEEVASAILNAYRPRDVAAFLAKERLGEAN